MSLSASLSALRRRAPAVLGCCLAGCSLASPAMAADPPPGCQGIPSRTWLRVVTEGVRDAKGQIAITLYGDDPSRFLARHGALLVARTPAIQGATPACIFVPKPGVYVVAVYHDENGNGSFDRSELGLPVEAYGFSNNPPTLLGLPSFRSIRLNVSKPGLSTHIQLKYP